MPRIECTSIIDHHKAKKIVKFIYGNINARIERKSFASLFDFYKENSVVYVYKSRKFRTSIIIKDHGVQVATSVFAKNDKQIKLWLIALTPTENPKEIIYSFKCISKYIEETVSSLTLMVPFMYVDEIMDEINKHREPVIEKKPTHIVAGFPGVGKSYLTKMFPESVLDSDSSSFSKDPTFPSNYLDHIKSNIGKYDLILVSTHKAVTDELIKQKIPFVLIYPDKSLKEEYLNRYRTRDDNKAPIDVIDKYWDTWITDIENLLGTPKVQLIRLNSEQYLSVLFESVNF